MIAAMRVKIVILILVSLLVACEKNSPQEISRVNDRSISKDDFLFAYETSPSSILTGPRELAYKRVLDRLIQRILLAQAAENLELQNEPGTAEELTLLEDAAIRRELFMRKVRQQVQISDEDCRQAFSRAQQTLWIQHTELSPGAETGVHGWNPDWAHIGINSTIKTITTEEFGEVDLVSWNDVSQELEQVLFGLELNEMSKPIYLDGVVHLFRLVNLETNIMTSENAYVLEQEHYKSALKKRREHYLAFDFVQSTMQPENLIIRRTVLDQVTDILWRHYAAEDSLLPDATGEVKFTVLNLDDMNDLELATFNSGDMSVADFRLYYRMNPIQLSRQSEEHLQRDLINAIGIYVRDLVFAEKGRSEGLAELQSVKDDYLYWQERLLASKMEQSIYQQVLSSESDHPENTNRVTTEKLNELCANLKRNAVININEDRLMEIVTSDADLVRRIDFFASYLN